MFHDVIYDKEIDIFMNLTKPKLYKAEVKRFLEKSEVDESHRVTQIGWLYDFEHEYVKTLNYRIKDMTNLNIDTAEQLQVSYYEIGGHYAPHYDFALEGDTTFFDDRIGNRIATVLFYLNDVEKGGHTVFTELNISLKPKKGAAAFWYNLKPNGKVDNSTMHSACPVISGFKWAANKWLHTVGQEFSRPCSRNNETIILN
ncbi:prolyl 4-hydroxylase subunit alpha-1-like isoform X2 [Leptopilina boulardi]|nr:prolyl 4-hydroxylase subunit alpha-1-like isoform X2 [Leptopilina boulardi]